MRITMNWADPLLALAGGLLLLVVLFVAGLVLYALPATLSLPRGRRPGLAPLTLPQAAQQLRASGKQGAEVVEAARVLVGSRMAYCRRNSFDLYPRAFERGYGYCQQSAYALVALLKALGFQAEVITAFRSRFPNGKVGGHAWVQVYLDGLPRQIDPQYYDPLTGELRFTPLTKVFAYSTPFRFLAGWGSAAVNAHRYYRTGQDYEDQRQINEHTNGLLL
jgi:transglutaminase-like putative cysteine protease